MVGQFQPHRSLGTSSAYRAASLGSSSSSTASEQIPSTPMTDTRTILWTLRRGDNRLECSVERPPHGLQVHMAVNGGTPYYQPDV